MNDDSIFFGSRILFLEKRYWGIHVIETVSNKQRSMFVKIGASVMNELVSVIPMDTAMYMFKVSDV